MSETVRRDDTTAGATDRAATCETGAAEAVPAPDPTAPLPCPRTVRVDGTYENGGACYGCGACLVPVFAPWN
jgi:hypothetical protein